MFLLTIYLPWLLNMLPYSYWALTCLAVLPTYSAFMISVRQASDLPPASFRFPVTQDTLALGYILPAVGRIGDFHPLKHAPAGRTKNSGRYHFRYLPLSVIFRSAPRILRYDSHPASQHLRTLRPPVSDFHPDQGLLPSDSGNTSPRSQGSSRSHISVRVQIVPSSVHPGMSTCCRSHFSAVKPTPPGSMTSKQHIPSRNSPENTCCSFVHRCPASLSRTPAIFICYVNLH